MILADASYQEIYRQMKAEEDKVRFFVKKVRGRVDKWARSAGILPYPGLVHEEYTVPSTKNRYIVYGYIQNEKELIHGSYTLIAALSLTSDEGSRCLVTLREWKFFTDDDVYEVEDALQFYTGHFFKRYRERAMLLNQSKDPEVTCTLFFGRNSGMSMRLDFGKLNIRAEEYPDGCAFRLYDGVAFASDHSFTLPDGKRVTVLRNNTFMGISQLKADQEEAIPSMEELILSAFRAIRSGRHE